MHRTYLKVFFWTLFAGGALVACVNLVVDPFGLRPGPRPALGQDAIALRADYRLFKLAQFTRRPRPDILLGDSRTEGLADSLFASRGVHAANLAYGGGTAFEEMDTFWFATRRVPIRSVVLSMPFNLYSERQDMNLVPAAIDQIENPFTHFLSISTLRVSVRILIASVTGRRLDSEAPPMSRQAFWDYQLAQGTSGQYRNWRYPYSLRPRLERMVAYCKEKGIRLVIFIPPTHVDLQERARAFALDSAYQRYKKDLHGFGVPVVDLDVPDDFTRARDNFSDPYHLEPHAKAAVVDALLAALHPPLRAP
jgi:hypothetical protein